VNIINDLLLVSSNNTALVLMNFTLPKAIEEDQILLQFSFYQNSGRNLVGNIFGIELNFDSFFDIDEPKINPLK